jgi:hypothetical protein
MVRADHFGGSRNQVVQLATTHLHARNSSNVFGLLPETFSIVSVTAYSRGTLDSRRNRDSPKRPATSAWVQPRALRSARTCSAIFVRAPSETFNQLVDGIVSGPRAQGAALSHVEQESRRIETSDKNLAIPIKCLQLIRRPSQSAPWPLRAADPSRLFYLDGAATGLSNRYAVRCADGRDANSSA